MTRSHTRSNGTGNPTIDCSVLQAMKPTAILINTARGSLIDEGPLTDAPIGRQIAGAGLDVVQNEPLTASHQLRDVETSSPKAALYSVADGVNRHEGSVIDGDPAAAKNLSSPQGPGADAQ